MTAHTCTVSDPDNCQRCDINEAAYERYVFGPPGVKWTPTYTREEVDYWLSRGFNVRQDAASDESAA